MDKEKLDRLIKSYDRICEGFIQAANMTEEEYAEFVMYLEARNSIVSADEPIQ